jgi:hypothetical protein
MIDFGLDGNRGDSDGPPVTDLKMNFASLHLFSYADSAQSMVT